MKAVNLIARARIGEQARRLGAPLGGLRETPGLRQVEEPVVGRAPHQEIREARGDLVAVQAEDAGLGGRGPGLDAVQELRILQHAPQHQVYGGVEVVLNSRVVLGRERLQREICGDLRFRQGPAEQPPSHRLDDLAKARGVAGPARCAGHDTASGRRREHARRDVIGCRLEPVYERRRRLLARVVVVEGRVLVLGENPARRVGRVSEQIADRGVDLGAAQAARDAGRDRVAARPPGATPSRAAGSVATDRAGAVRRRRGDDSDRRQPCKRDSVCCRVKHRTTLPTARAAGPRIRPTDANRCERVGAVGFAPPRPPGAKLSRAATPADRRWRRRRRRRRARRRGSRGGARVGAGRGGAPPRCRAARPSRRSGGGGNGKATPRRT